MYIASLDYFNRILDDPKNNHYRLVFNLLARPATTSNEELKRKQFSSVIKGADERKFGELFNSFITRDKYLLNSELAHHIAVNSKGEKRLDYIEAIHLE